MANASSTPTSAPAPPTRSRVRSRPSTSWARASRRSPPSTTRRPTARGLVEAFSAEFTKGGGEIVTAQTINADDTSKDYSSVVAAIKPTAPQAVYYGGEYPQAGPFSQQMKGNGLNVPLMGGDGIYDPKFIGSPRRPAMVTSPPRSAPRPTPPMPARPSSPPTRRPASRSPLPPTVATLRRRQRHHRGPQDLAEGRHRRQVGT